MRYSIPFLAALSILATASLSAQNNAFVVEAEKAALGTGLKTATDGSITYVTPVADSGGSVPASANIGTLTISFPKAGVYDLYAKIYVGEGGASDDSLFYANAFGNATAMSSLYWVTANNLVSYGYSNDSDTVGDTGSAASGVWKWVKLSAMDTNSVVYVVKSGALTQYLQFAGREDGLRIDKFAFGLEGVSYTVSQLENGQDGTLTSSETTPTGPEIAKGKGKFFGSCYSESPDQNTNFSDYWNAVIPGNGGKWGWVEYSRGTMNWSTLDEAYGFAKSHNYPFCFHVLVWGSQQPTWMKNLSKDDQLAEIKKWYQAVADRYPDIDYLQVVNEALHAPPDNSKNDSGNYIDALGGTGTTGHDWVLEAFRLARQYFPHTRLMINDYNVVGTTDQTNAYLAIIKDLQKENLVDLIGIQAHAFETKYYSAASIKTNLDSLAATGLDIMVTEMDIDGVSDNVQLTEYERVFPIFWKHPAVIGVCLWGYRVGLWRTSSGSYLTDNNGAERPAFLWLQDYVRNSEEWNGYPVTNGWANTGRWMGWVNIEKAPWCYVGKSWVWFASDTYSKESGCWGYIMNSQGKGTATGENSWHGYPVTNGWANTGNWMGWVNIAYAPKLWTDYGWVYLMEDTVNDNGAWAWFYK